MKTNRTIFEPRGKTIKDITTFTSSGTWNKPSWCAGVVVYVTGGGGGAGAGNYMSGASYGGGSGSAGGMAIKLIDEHSLTNSTETVTVGNYGAGGLTGHGATGGASSFGSHATGNGGGGGGSAASIPRRIGGTATGGDVNISGGDGYPGSFSSSTGSVIPLQVAAAAMWGGCRMGQSIQGPPNVGYWYGCGGASAVGSGTYGGNGKEGIVIIYELEGI